MYMYIHTLVYIVFTHRKIFNLERSDSRLDY